MYPPVMTDVTLSRSHTGFTPCLFLYEYDLNRLGLFRLMSPTRMLDGKIPTSLPKSTAQAGVCTGKKLEEDQAGNTMHDDVYLVTLVCKS